MDSMRNLSTSLPSSRRRADGPELLTDFKAAALSVTNLYKSAAASQVKSRAAGYQDALDDLLAFLDKENLGLMDGEGWRVRQWATERLDDGIQKQAASDDDEEVVREDAVRAESRSSSPEVQRKANMPTAAAEVIDASSPPPRVASEPPHQRAQTPQTSQPPTAPRDEFTFRSNHAYPTNHDRESGMDVDISSVATAPSTPSSTETVRIVSRHPRNRHTTHNRQRENRTLNVNLGPGAGSKRRLPYPDFFDISSIPGFNFDGNDRREGQGGRSTKRRIG